MSEDESASASREDENEGAGKTLFLKGEKLKFLYIYEHICWCLKGAGKMKVQLR